MSSEEEATEAGWQDKIDKAIEERFQTLISMKARIKSDGGNSDGDVPVKHAGEL